MSLLFKRSWATRKAFELWFCRNVWSFFKESGENEWFFYLLLDSYNILFTCSWCHLSNCHPKSAKNASTTLRCAKRTQSSQMNLFHLSLKMKNLCSGWSQVQLFHPKTLGARRHTPLHQASKSLQCMKTKGLRRINLSILTRYKTSGPAIQKKSARFPLTRGDETFKCDFPECHMKFDTQYKLSRHKVRSVKNLDNILNLFYLQNSTHSSVIKSCSNKGSGAGGK